MNETRTLKIPEILAPAGDDESLTAALRGGADAVYFGLAEGFNARARAENFTVARLPATVERIHRSGAKAYVTLNTLVFDRELPVVGRLLSAVAGAGVDAILVQDPAVALLARELAPSLSVHASTQMTLSSAEGMALARELGIERVVLPRELTVDEIGILRASTDLELEVFVHGALCVSWSGQCLTSEAWGGRSANRGQCAQSCRLPYTLVIDGDARDLGDVAYLLSPHDLAAWRVIPRLIDLGIASLKIEGRQKGAQYVMTAVEAYRKARDRAVERGGAALLDREDEEAMAVSFSRGFSPGFLSGVDHQELVEGRSPTHRGLKLGVVEAVEGAEVILRAASEARLPHPGDGVVFERGSGSAGETGGPVFAASIDSRGRFHLRFGRPGPDRALIARGASAWKTSDAAVTRHVRRRLREALPEGGRRLDLVVSGKVDETLVVVGRAGDRSATVRSTSVLTPATGGGLGAELLAEKLGRLGGTGFTLGALEVTGLEAGLHLPVSALNDLRRRLVAALAESDHEAPAAPRPVEDVESVIAKLLDRWKPESITTPATARIIPLCRTDAQLDAALESGCDEIELDWMEMVGLERAVAKVRSAGRRVTIATLRVQKPGEEGYDRRIARLDPDGLLVRHWGALEAFRGRSGEGGRPVLHGDFSLNVTNGVTGRFLLARGLADLTPAHDLDATQLGNLLDHVEPARVTIVLHHHIATFHTEHCVYAHLMSNGKDFRTCGRPCEEHRVALRDRTGDEHPVVVDVGCRNTVFNARAQTAAGLVADLRRRGVARFRVEFVAESREETARALAAYRDLLAGTITAPEAVRAVGAAEKFGVTGGTLRVMT